MSGYIENIFKEVDEVWIFDAKEPNGDYSYWDSWFTQCEFISLMTLRQNMPNHCPTIIHFDALAGQYQVVDKMPELPKDLDEKLSVIMANSDLNYGDIVAWKTMCRIKNVWNNLSEEAQKKMNMVASDMIQSDIDMQKQFSSRSYDEDFLTNRIFSCKKCLKKGNSMKSFESYDFVNSFIEIDSSNENKRMINNKRGYFSIDDKELQTILSKNDGIIECPNCHTKYRISPSLQVYYIWERYIPQITEIRVEEHNYIDKIQTFKIESYV